MATSGTAKGRYSPTERIGVNAVEAIVLKELDWIFREQPISDMGIDAHIELVDVGAPTGKLMAVQIKTGMSHFRDTGTALVYYGTLAHLDYWTGHSLPVVLIAHLPDKGGETFWVVINEKAIIRTEKAWKIEIPKANIFSKKTVSELEAAFEGSPAQQRFRKLTIDEPLMRHVQKGGTVSMELEDWVNKSLGRTTVKVFVIDEEGDETLSQDWFQYYVGYGMKELAKALFPWAEASVDEEFYENNADVPDDWREQLERATDLDNGVETEPGSRDLDGAVYPYTEALGGEVECYRLKLTLNDLGHAFLTVSDHISGQDSPDTSPEGKLYEL